METLMLKENKKKNYGVRILIGILGMKSNNIYTIEELTFPQITKKMVVYIYI